MQDSGSLVTRVGTQSGNRAGKWLDGNAKGRPLAAAPPVSTSTSSVRDQTSAPWQCLNFLPDPQGQSALRPGVPQVVGSFSSKPGT